MAVYFIDLSVKKGRIEYADEASRDADFQRILKFFRDRSFTASDVILKRVNRLVLRGIDNPVITQDYDHVVEVQ